MHELDRIPANPASSGRLEGPQNRRRGRIVLQGTRVPRSCAGCKV